MSSDPTFEQRLNDVAARYEGLLAAAVDAIVVIDRHGIVEAFNPAAERIFLCRAGEIVGRNVSMLMPEPDASLHDRYIDNYVRTGHAHIIGIGREVTGRRMNGALFPMELAVGEVRSPEGLKFVGIVRDVTSRREMERALRAREAELRLILDAAPIGIFTCEASGLIISANPALAEMLQYGSGQLIGSQLATFMDADDARTLAATFGGLAAGTAVPRPVAIRWHRRDGARLYTTLHLAVVARPQAGLAIVGQVVDMTERLRIEEAAQQAREQLAHVGRLTTLGEMASAIAHEINQPLTAISAQAQACRRLLATGQDDAGVLQEAFERIADQALRAGEVVKRIRGFVTKRESHKERCSLNALMQQVLELAAVDLRSAGVEVQTALAPALPPVVADPVQLQQVFLNLVLNAVDAMREQPPTARRLSIRTAREGDGVALTVDDCGAGVPPAERAHLFHPFFTTKPDGMGMGLSISHSIVAAHGGSLRYAENPAGGARFVVGLPVSAE